LEKPKVEGSIKTMSYIYEHIPEDKDIGFEGRSYAVAERLLEYKDRKVLYLNTEASEVSFCDRSYAMHLGSIIVKGYVVRWKYGKNEKGEALSEIEPVKNEEEQREISKLLRDGYNIATVRFF
jgi:hypothetical protein